MAFLCSARVKRSKKTKDSDKPSSRQPLLGRITGSASVETLVRVGIEKENGLSPDSKMVVLHDFTPCVDDELEVKRGQIVNILYQEKGWIYVIAENNQEGFIPHSYCAPVASQLADLAFNVKCKKIPRNGLETSTSTSSMDIHHHHQETNGHHLHHHHHHHHHHTNDNENDTNQDDNVLNDDDEVDDGSPVEVSPFTKNPSGHYVVLFTFIARDENDVSVERGESVTVLNQEDPDWFWIVRSDGQEGFVPSSFLCSFDMVQDPNIVQQVASAPISNANSSSSINQISNGNGNSGNGQTGNCNQATSQESEGRPQGTELVMLYDYKAQAPDDLSVRRGDWIYANYSTQTVDGWLWAYAPKIRKYGFIPKAYARPPAITS